MKGGFAKTVKTDAVEVIATGGIAYAGASALLNNGTIEFGNAEIGSAAFTGGVAAVEKAGAAIVHDMVRPMITKQGGAEMIEDGMVFAAQCIAPELLGDDYKAYCTEMNNRFVVAGMHGAASWGSHYVAALVK